jgi:hypothetical protein
MLLHWNFCTEWFTSNTKENLKSFRKWLWKIGKEKEKGSPSFPSFWPVGPAGCSSLSPPLAAWPYPFCGPAPHHGARPLLLSLLCVLGQAQLATGPTLRARPCSLPLSLADALGPHASDYVVVFLPKPTQTSLSKIPHRRIPLLNLHLPFLAHLRAI